MADDFLADFLNNPNRAKLLRVFAFNPTVSYTTMALSKRSGLSARSIEPELKSLYKIGIIKKSRPELEQKNKKTKSVKVSTWIFNESFRFAHSITKFVYEATPLKYNNVISALRRSARPAAIILSGCFVGDSTRPADIIFAADRINEKTLEQAVKKLEPVYGRELRYAAFSTPEFRYRLTISDKLMRETLDYPHLVLLDKTRLL